MASETQRVRVEEADWRALLAFPRLFGAFQMAIHPSKLVLSFGLVVCLLLTGVVMDWLWGPRVYPDEIRRYATLSADQYSRWLERTRGGGLPKQMGVYAAGAQFKMDAVGRLLGHTGELSPGVKPALLTPTRRGWCACMAVLRDLFVVLPGWLFEHHRVFLLVYSLMALVFTAWLGGAVARMAALHATRDQRITWREAVGFAGSQWRGFFFAPLLPMILAGVMALILAMGGFVLFNWPGLDVLGGVGFVVALFLGAVVAFLLLLTVAAGPLLYPAIAVDGADVFDAVSRAFGYVLGRPWRWVCYSAIAMAYGVVTYVLVGGVIFLTLWVTHRCVGLWVFREAASGMGRFEAIFPVPRFGAWPQPQWDQLGVVSKAAGGLVMFWVYLAVLLISAYAVSFYFSASTWVYLLLRRAVDGVGFEQVDTAGPESDAGQRVGIATPPPSDAGDTASAPPTTPGTPGTGP